MLELPVGEVACFGPTQLQVLLLLVKGWLIEYDLPVLTLDFEFMLSLGKIEGVELHPHLCEEIVIDVCLLPHEFELVASIRC